MNYNELKPVCEQDLNVLANGVTDLRDRAIISLLIESGLRAAEIVGLDREMVTIHADGTGGAGEFAQHKSSTKRMFCFGPKTAKALHAYLSSDRLDDNAPTLFLGYKGERLTVPQLSNMVRRWCNKLGIEHISTRQFRHAFALRLANAGISIEVLMRLLGCQYRSAMKTLCTWTKSTVTQEYQRVTVIARDGSEA